MAEKFQTEGKLDLAKSAIDEAALNDQTKDNPRTWYLRSFIYKELFKNAKPSKETVNQQAIQYRNASIESARKSLALDKKKELSKECYSIVNFLRNSMIVEAYSSFKLKDDNTALASLEEYLEVSSSFANAEEDAQAYFIAGVSAYRLNNAQKAEKYLSKAEALGQPDPAVYVYLARTYWAANKKQEALNILNKGFTKYPKNKEIVSTLYEFNREQEKLKENLEFLTIAVEANPGEADFWILLAITYEDIASKDVDNKKNETLEKAKEAYIQALRIRPNDDFANSNIGILLYNQGVNLINSTDVEISLPDIANIQRLALSKFKESLPYMLKAYDLNPKRKETLYGLDVIYYVMGEFDKSNQFKLLYQKAE